MIKEISPTPELLYKSIFGYTKEVMDILFEKAFISEEEHYVALKFRILRSKVFGSAFVTANDFSCISSGDFFKSLDEDDEENYRLYNKVLDVFVARHDLKNIVNNICVFNIPPCNYEEIKKFQMALEIMSPVFKSLFDDLSNRVLT